MLKSFYDLRTSPPSFNFTEFLCLSENVRLRLGEDSLKIYFVKWGNESRRKGEHLYGRDGLQNMIDRVCKPMCQLIPACVGYEEISAVEAEKLAKESPSMGLGEELIGVPIAMMLWRQNFFPFVAPGAKKKNPNLITLTTRNAKHSPVRNSNIVEWEKVSRELTALGYEVYWMAEDEDLLNRAKLYSEAKMNLMATGGLWHVALNLRSPQMVFKPVTEAVYCSSSEYLRQCGLSKENNSQIPNARADQKIIWAQDTADNILSAFFEFNQSEVVECHY